MATFGDIQGIVYSQLGGSASLAASLKTQAKFFINAVQQRIINRREWWFLSREKEIYTIADEKAGTCSITNGNAAVGGATTSWNAANGVIAGSFFQKAGDNEVYEVNSVATTTRLDLVSTYRGTTKATASFNCFQQFYDLGSDVHTILNVRDMTMPQDLDYISDKELDELDPGYDFTGTPEHYTLRVRKSNGNLQVGLYPRANGVRQLRVRYKKVVGDLSATSSTPVIPARYHHLLAWGAMAEMDLFEYEQRRDFAAKLEQGVAEMMRDEPVVIDRQWRRQRYQGDVRFRGGRLPPEYGSF